MTAQPCKLFAAGAEGTAIGRPTQVQLPAQVRLPQGAGVYILDDTQKQYIIGPAGMECSRSFGASGGVTSIGEMRTGIVQHTFQGSIGGIELSMCQYFPDSAQARPGTDCSSSLRTGRNLPTGVPGTQAVIATDAPEGGQAPPSPYVSVTLATLGKDRVPMPIQCVMPWDRASICTAALTYWFIQNVKGVGQADLDRVVKTISAAVTSSRR
ncbi:MAG: hypothetical protein IRY90_16545 [Actinomadura rubrobrunea]|nr:hypothetical protein [Actinomadura rubrobrunea]